MTSVGTSTHEFLSLQL